MKSQSGLYEIWTVDVDGAPLFCEDKRLTLPDANERLRELLESGVYGDRLVLALPRDRSFG